MVWKFTADKNYLAQVGPLAGSYGYGYVSTIVKNNDTQKNGISGTEAAAKGIAAIYSINGTKMAGTEARHLRDLRRRKDEKGGGGIRPRRQQKIIYT